MANLTFSTFDRLGKRTSMNFRAADAVTNLAVQDFVDDLDAIIRGSDVRGAKTIETVVDNGSAAPPADEEANRGNKWLFRFQDNVTGQIYTHEIGTADNTQLPSATSDFIDLTATVGLAIKTTAEVIYQSPDGNAGTLLSIQQVTRTD